MLNIGDRVRLKEKLGYAYKGDMGFIVGKDNDSYFLEMDDTRIGFHTCENHTPPNRGMYLMFFLEDLVEVVND